MKRTILLLGLAASVASAQPAPEPQARAMMGDRGPGWGMMADQDFGYGSGHGPGWGYGPGCAMGPVAHRGYGSGWAMGPGAHWSRHPGYRMGSRGADGPAYGRAPGMAADWGMGAGMMGAGAGRALAMLDLDDRQRSELAKIQDESRRKQWEIAGKMHDEMAKMRDAMTAPEKRDRAAAMASFDRITALRRQRLENALDAADRVDQALTPEQRERMRRWTPWWAAGAWDGQ